MYGMVEIVVPLGRGMAWLARIVTAQISSFIAIVFQYQMHIALASRTMLDGIGKLFDDIQ